MSYNWKCVKFNRNDKRNFFNFTNCNFDHPLKEHKTIVFESKGTRNRLSQISSVSTSKSSLDVLSLDGSDDPLSQFARQELDPLSQMVAEEAEINVIASKSSNKVTTNSHKKPLLDSSSSSSVASWNSRRAIILNKYTTSEKLTIATSFLGAENIVRNQTQVEKVKHRLEQLDDFQDIHYMQNLTQQEYVSKIQQLNAELIASWKTDQRVKSLKIAIQCSKLLADSSAVMQFYPSKFVLVTDILDIFGKLVYDRLKSKSEDEKSLPDNFTSKMIPEAAKETCLNWFYKVASIRELIPRLYVEMSLIRCYRFVNSNEIKAALERISRMIRGIGDPLVAVYARCYLMRVGVSTCEKQDYQESFNDFLNIYQSIFNGGIRGEINKQNINLGIYLSLYSPALDWMVQNLSLTATDVQLEDFLTQCKDKKNNSLLMMTILHSFRPEFVTARAMEFVVTLADTSSEGITKGALFRQLGNIISLFPPPIDQRPIVLNEAWKTINTITNAGDYVACVELWSQFIAANFNIETVNKFFGDVLARVTPRRAFEMLYNELQGIMDKTVTNVRDFYGLLNMENFLPILDLFQKETVKFSVCKNILEKYKNFYSNADENEMTIIISDPVTITAFMCIAKVLNDGVNAQTSDDERRNIGNLISSFIMHVSFGRDFEQQLNFYVDARGSFANFDNVLYALVNCVNKLAMDTRKIVKANHTRKTAAFVKACAAYSFITIPSIISITQRLDLYVLTGQTSLANLCLGQADACFEAAIQLLSELPKTLDVDGRQKNSDFYLQSYVLKLLSIFIVVPDSPERGVLYLLRLLIEKLREEIDFDVNQPTQSIIYVNVIDTLCCFSQETYPYHLHNVISNDQLYGNDPKFINEINELATCVLNDLLSLLQGMSTERPKLQSAIALELFERVATKADLCDDKMFTLAGNLWNLSVKNRQDAKMHQKIYQHVQSIRRAVKSQGNENYSQRLDELLIRIKNKL